MINTTQHKIRGWKPDKESWFGFLKRLVKECGKRTSEALSPAWVRNQIQVFILKKGGPEKLHGKVLDPITKALQSSGLSDAFYQNTNIEIVMQIAKDQILSIKKIDKKKIEVQFQFNSNSWQTSYRVDFENSESGFGGLDALAARGLVELDRAEQVVEVRDGQRRLAIRSCGGHDIVDPVGAVDDGKFGVQAQVDEHGSIVDFATRPARRRQCLPSNHRHHRRNSGCNPGRRAATIASRPCFRSEAWQSVHCWSSACTTPGASGSTAQAGFLLGVILLALGLATGAAGGRQTVRIDASAREIRIDDRGLTGTQPHHRLWRYPHRAAGLPMQTRTRHALRYLKPTWSIAWVDLPGGKYR